MWNWTACHKQNSPVAVAVYQPRSTEATRWPWTSCSQRCSSAEDRWRHERVRWARRHVTEPDVPPVLRPDERHRRRSRWQVGWAAFVAAADRAPVHRASQPWPTKRRKKTYVFLQNLYYEFYECCPDSDCWRLRFNLIADVVHLTNYCDNVNVNVTAFMYHAGLITQ